MKCIIAIKDKIISWYTYISLYIKYYLVINRSKKLRRQIQQLTELKENQEFKDKLIDVVQDTKSHDFDTLIKFMRKDKL